MTPTKLNRAPLTKRISALAVTAAAALSFTIFAPSAQAADSKELIALKGALSSLPGSPTLANATPDELEAAVEKAITDNAGLKPGNIAGEALKNAGDQTAGDEIGQGLIDAGATDILNARDAIKRAGSGKTLNVNLVPDFTTKFVDDNDEAVILANLVKSSKPGAGAVIGGRASQLLTDIERFNLVTLALNEKLTAAAQDITKFVVREVVGDTADFTRDIAVAFSKLASKVGTGGVAGDPTNGGAIVDTLLSDANLPTLKSGVAGFIKSVATVADIEEISKIANAVGDQIGTAATIKFSKANGIVKSLAKAIVAKATTDSTPTNPHSILNKQDEIAEVAAHMVGRTITEVTTGGAKPQLTLKNAKAKILALVKSAVGATKGKKVAAFAPDLFNKTAVDVAGSVAETLGSLRDEATLNIPDEFFDTIIAFLKAKAATIGGKANAGAIETAITAAYTSGASDDFEDGNPSNPQTALSDYPETDFRAF